MPGNKFLASHYLSPYILNLLTHTHVHTPTHTNTHTAITKQNHPTNQWH